MCVVRYLALPRWTDECYCAAMPIGISTMRLFTGFAGSQRVLTLNATDVQEAEGRTHHARRDGRRQSDHPARNA